MKKSLLAGVALAAVMSFGGSAWADVILGIGAPLTGPNAVYGAQIQKGAEAAIKEVNDAGGINGEKITISLGDDVSDPKQGISVANKFAADGVKYVIGHFNSGVSIPASEVYAETAFSKSRLPRPIRSIPSVSCGTRSAPAAVTTSRASWLASTSSTISRMRRSPSFTTRPHTVRALPTKPRRSSTSLAPRKPPL